MIGGIEHFVAVAETGGFRAAGARLGMSPAAVSKAVARLEAELGARLFDRSSRRVALTPEGELFLRHARQALDALQAGRDLVDRAERAPQGTVRVSVPHVLGHAVTAALPRLLQRHPRLDVDLQVTDRQADLIGEELDVVVRIGDLEDSGLVAKRLGNLRWTVVASPAYLARGAPSHPDEVAHHDGVVFRSPAGTDTPWEFAVRGEVVRRRPRARLRVDQGERLVDAALGGVGLAHVFDFMVAEHVAAGRLVEVLAAFSAGGPPVHALYLPSRRRSARVRAFLELVEDVL